jgi:hypothetical protein
MPPSNPALRHEVLRVYKGKFRCSASLSHFQTLIINVELLFLLREYPLGYDYARPRLHKAFMSQAGLQDEEKIKYGIKRAEFVKKGTQSSLWRALL